MTSGPDALSLSWQWHTRPVADAEEEYPHKQQSLALFCCATQLPLTEVVTNRVIQSILNCAEVDDKMLHVALGRCVPHFIHRRDSGTEIRYPGGYLATLIFVYAPELRPLVRKERQQPTTKIQRTDFMLLRAASDINAADAAAYSAPPPPPALHPRRHTPLDLHSRPWAEAKHRQGP